jgi:hypothetical protein
MLNEQTNLTKLDFGKNEITKFETKSETNCTPSKNNIHSAFTMVNNPEKL